MIDEQALREFANTLISEPVSRSIEEIECAGEFIKVLLDELQSLRSERTAWRATAENAEKDAARYRWLLANYARGDGYDAIDQALNDGEPDTQLSPAIDAAIAAATKETP